MSRCKLKGLTNIRTFPCLRQSIGHHLTCLRRSHQAGQSIVGERERLLWRKGSNFCFWQVCDVPARPRCGRYQREERTSRGRQVSVANDPGCVKVHEAAPMRSLIGCYTRSLKDIALSRRSNSGRKLMSLSCVTRAYSLTHYTVIFKEHAKLSTYVVGFPCAFLPDKLASRRPGVPLKASQ